MKLENWILKITVFIYDKIFNQVKELIWLMFPFNNP